MESTRQVNQKIDIIFNNFLEDRDILNKDSFPEKLVLFSQKNNLKRYLWHIKFLLWLSGSGFFSSLFFLANKARLVKKNMPISDIDQVKLSLILSCAFGLALMIMFLLNAILTMIVDQKSLREIFEDSKKQCLQRLDFYFENNTSKNSKNNSRTFKINNDDSDIDNFIIESLTSYFQFLINKTDKRKDSMDACIPFATLILILMSVFVIGLPSIPGLEKLPSYYGFPTFAVFLNAIYKPVIALPSNNLSMKYSKCLLKIENLKSVRNIDQVKIEEALKRVS
jgi:hypothetical protein